MPRSLDRRLALAALACLLAILVGVGTSADAAAPSSALPRPSSVSVLYVLGAGSATLRPAGADGRFVLTLRQLDRRAVWFSDRPARRSSAFPSSALALAWRGLGFQSDPPNAALVYTDARGAQRTAIVELSQPRVGGNGETLSFSARLVDPRSVKEGDLATHAAVADRHPPRGLRQPSLFIDDGEAVVFRGCLVEPETTCWRADFQAVEMQEVELYGSTLEEADFQDAQLQGARLEYALLLGAEFQHASLEGADLRGALLSGARFLDANLTRANLQSAITLEAGFAGAKFCETTMPSGSVNDSDC